MKPLERLFALEVDFHRRVREGVTGRAGIAAVHTSYAMQSGYEPLIREAGRPDALVPIQPTLRQPLWWAFAMWSTTQTHKTRMLR